ncbi:aromatic prenyltransferase [Pholiota molesta]|nr:aromatic prenyltransferase [Pholiota molesta]
MSYMGDDHTPIELSWVLNATGNHTVRFTLEPLSNQTGAPSPSHTWIKSLHTLSQNPHVTNFSLDWANVCFDSLIYNGDVLKFNPPHYSQFSIGADFTHKNGIVGKAYFLPHIRSLATGISPMDLVTSCIEQLELGPQWSLITAYIRDVAPHLEAVPDIVAVDCIPTHRNRVKIYVRSNASSLEEIIDFFTLGHSLDDPIINHTVETIRELWHLLFPGIDDKQCVKSANPSHYASRFPIYFELASSSKFPHPKLYIPVRHYCPNDSTVVQAISQFYERHGFEGVSNVYLSGIQSALKYSHLSDSIGMHTYLGIATRKGGPQLSIYLSPLAFTL